MRRLHAGPRTKTAHRSWDHNGGELPSGHLVHRSPLLIPEFGRSGPPGPHAHFAALLPFIICLTLRHVLICNALDWEEKPGSPASIRLISMGLELQDNEQLKGISHPIFRRSTNVGLRM